MKTYLLLPILFFPFFPPSFAETLQNISPFTFVLTKTVINNAHCIPDCKLKSLLLPQAIQDYLIDPTGSIVFDYDIQKDTKIIGHTTIKATPSSLVITNGLGTTLLSANSTYQINYVSPIPIWEGKFNSINTWTNNNWNVSSLPSWGSQNIEVRASSTSDASPKGDNYLRINYPAGSANSASSPPLPLGGAQFYGAMINSNTPILLSFYIRFPITFPFIGQTRPYTVGKLPGLYSGRGNTGTNVPTGYDGWSTRFMWCDVQPSGKKIKGGGEVLQFTYGSNTGKSGTVNGTFLGCGSWSFKPDGLWHNIQQTVYLNDLGKTNGRIDICYDGNLVFSQDNITFRLTSALQINGILFQTFFGGSGKEYATPVNTYADFADFALYNYPVTEPRGLCVRNR